MRASSRSLILRTAIATAGLVGTACSTPVTPESPIAIRPDGSSFARVSGGAAVVPYTVSNTGTVTVLLTSRCGDHLEPAIERRTDAGWVQYAGGACLAIYPTSPVPLAGGGLREDAASVSDAGEYRLVLGTDRGPATSTAFVIR